jgi:hypothetical protein
MVCAKDDRGPFIQENSAGEASTNSTRTPEAIDLGRLISGLGPAAVRGNRAKATIERRLRGTTSKDRRGHLPRPPEK